MDRRRINQRYGDLSRALKRESPYEIFQLSLYIVTGSTPITGTSYRWVYTIKPATFNNSPNSPDFHTPYVNPNFTGTGYYALAASEFSNDATPANQFYSYGVQDSDLVGSIVPVKIPDGTAVVAFPLKDDNGNGRFIIINTQAITGQC